MTFAVINQVIADVHRALAGIQSQRGVTCRSDFPDGVVQTTVLTMNQGTYNFSFTAGGLLITESIRVAETYEQTRDWDATVDQVRERNLLQAQTQSTAERKLREIQPRLRTLTGPQIGLVVNGSPSEQLAILWLAVCKRYAFLHDFASQVVRELFLSLQHSVTNLHVKDFLESQAVWHEEIDMLTDTTKNKVCTVTLRMLREAGITTDDGGICPALLTPDTASAIARESRRWFAIYPIAESDIPEVAA